jgi:hypothetical protein
MGIVVFNLLKYRDARYTVSGTYSRTRLRYTSSFCSHGVREQRGQPGGERNSSRGRDRDGRRDGGSQCSERGEEKKKKKKKKVSPSHTYPVAVRVVESLEFDDVGMAHDPHNLKLTILQESKTNGLAWGEKRSPNPWSIQRIQDSANVRLTLNRLSCKTLLMAASSPLGAILV